MLLKRKPLQRWTTTLHKTERKDYLFYALVVVVLLLAVTRQLFPKIFSKPFKFLFEASFRQKQRREKLMQEACHLY